jgi:hypothetical protein
MFGIVLTDLQLDDDTSSMRSESPTRNTDRRTGASLRPESVRGVVQVSPQNELRYQRKRFRRFHFRNPSVASGPVVCTRLGGAAGTSDILRRASSRDNGLLLHLLTAGNSASPSPSSYLAPAGDAEEFP